jgi:hypothetical protein
MSRTWHEFTVPRALATSDCWSDAEGVVANSRWAPITVLMWRVAAACCLVSGTPSRFRVGRICSRRAATFGWLSQLGPPPFVQCCARPGFQELFDLLARLRFPAGARKSDCHQAQRIVVRPVRRQRLRQPSAPTWSELYSAVKPAGEIVDVL